MKYGSDPLPGGRRSREVASTSLTSRRISDVSFATLLCDSGEFLIGIGCECVVQPSVVYRAVNRKLILSLRVLKRLMFK